MKLKDGDIKTREVLGWQGVHLLHFRFSSCSQKTRIFLNLKGIDWQSHPVNLMRQDNYKGWFLGINPRGLVPVLVHDGAVHIESNDILSYLDGTFPQNPLIPEDLASQVETGLKEEDDLHLDIRALTMRFLIPGRATAKKPELLENYASDPGTLKGQADPHKAVELEFWRDYAAGGISDERARLAANNFRRVYERFDRDLESNSYLLGDAPTLLDIAWFIYTDRLTAAGYPFQRLHPNVSDWFQRLSAMDAFAKEVSPPPAMRLVLAAMAAWQRITGRTLNQLIERRVAE
jgi:glutathione S-transferase